MTRRVFLSAAFPATIKIPVHHIFDARAKLNSDQTHYFWSTLWHEATRDLGRCGIRLECSRKEGEVRRSASGRPILTGLQHGVLNFVVTDQIPVQWDRGRGVAGLTTRYEGHHVCMVALNHAHGHKVPFLAVNTCVHELLHALLLDIFESRPKGLHGATRELRIDQFATRLWLLHDGAAIRRSARIYVERLRPLDRTVPV